METREGSGHERQTRARETDRVTWTRHKILIIRINITKVNKVDEVKDVKRLRGERCKGRENVKNGRRLIGLILEKKIPINDTNKDIHRIVKQRDDTQLRLKQFIRQKVEQKVIKVIG